MPLWLGFCLKAKRKLQDNQRGNIHTSLCRWTPNSPFWADLCCRGQSNFDGELLNQQDIWTPQEGECLIPLEDLDKTQTLANRLLFLLCEVLFLLSSVKLWVGAHHMNYSLVDWSSLIWGKSNLLAVDTLNCCGRGRKW